MKYNAVALDVKCQHLLCDVQELITISLDSHSKEDQ